VNISGSRIDFVVPGIPGPGRAVHRVHQPGHRHRLRARRYGVLKRAGRLPPCRGPALIGGQDADGAGPSRVRAGPSSSAGLGAALGWQPHTSAAGVAGGGAAPAGPGRRRFSGLGPAAGRHAGGPRPTLGRRQTLVYLVMLGIGGGPVPAGPVPGRDSSPVLKLLPGRPAAPWPTGLPPSAACCPQRRPAGPPRPCSCSWCGGRPPAITPSPRAHRSAGK